MKYSLVVGMAKATNGKPSLRDINIAIDTLDVNADNPFIILDPSEPIDNSNFVQVVYYCERYNDVNIYQTEIQFAEGKKFRQYKYVTINKLEVKEIFKNYFLFQKIPNLDLWKDITDEVVNEKKRRDYFFIYELAKNYYRDSKDIFNCYGYYHGDRINNDIELLQSISEAIVLIKDIVTGGSPHGDIYYANDGKKIYMDITIPNIWKGKIEKVSRIKGFLEGENIFISCCDSDNSHIISNVSPLPDLERLLASFMLLFAERILSDDKYLYVAMNYFFTPVEEKFRDTYSAFMNNPKRLSYYIAYEDDDDFNLSGYTAFSSIYKNFGMNKMNEMKML